MNLLMLIIIFLALVVAGSIAFIAWELTGEKPILKRKVEPGSGDAPDSARGSNEGP